MLDLLRCAQRKSLSHSYLSSFVVIVVVVYLLFILFYLQSMILLAYQTILPGVHNEVYQIEFKCEHCGHAANEVRRDGVSKLGRRYELQVREPEGERFLALCDALCGASKRVCQISATTRNAMLAVCCARPWTTHKLSCFIFFCLALFFLLTFLSK